MVEWIAIIILFIVVISHERALKKHENKLLELDHFAEMKYFAALKQMANLRKRQAERKMEELRKQQAE